MRHHSRVFQQVTRGINYSLFALPVGTQSISWPKSIVAKGWRLSWVPWSTQQRLCSAESFSHDLQQPVSSPGKHSHGSKNVAFTYTIGPRVVIALRPQTSPSDIFVFTVGKEDTVDTLREMVWSSLVNHRTQRMVAVENEDGIQYGSLVKLKFLIDTRWLLSVGSDQFHLMSPKDAGKKILVCSNQRTAITIPSLQILLHRNSLYKGLTMN